MAEDSDFNWTVELEVGLFHAMRKHKPVGVPKHFQMTFIHEKINSSVSKHVSTANIWKHLSTMYDLQALDTSEIIPFPNKEIEFSLPKEDFGEILAQEFPRVSGSSDSLVTAASVGDERPATSSSTPAVTPVTSTSVTPSSKDRVRHGSGSSRGKGDKQEKHTKEEKGAEETPKRDARKRTRHSLQSPAVDGVINKRQRRT